MSGRQQQLAQHRAALLERSGQLRAALGTYGAHIGARLSLIDRGLRLAKSATERPLLVSAVGLLFMLFKPIRALKWTARGAVVTSLVRQLLGFIQFGKTPRSERD